MFNANTERGNVSKLEERLVFFFVCMGVVTVTYGIFLLVDFLPEKPETRAEENITAPEENTTVETPAEEEEAPVDPFPISIVFDTLDKEVKVINPESDAVTALDAALLSGVVRHPDSADFEHVGTIFLLGHSSYLPSVRNKNFQSFNGIQKLEWGDTVRLRSNDTEYVYSVDRVYEVKASEAEVPIQFGESKLVLATCNSFGTKDDRFIVEASLVETRAL